MKHRGSDIHWPRRDRRRHLPLSLLCASVSLAVALLFVPPAGAQAAPVPLTPAASVALALRLCQQARAARFAHEAARAEDERDRPVARPTLNATAAGTVQGPHVLFPRPDGTDATFLPEEAGRVDLVLEQLLYRAGQGAARRRYTAETAVADQDYLKALSDLALSVRKAYLDVLRADSGLRVAQDGMDAAQRYQDLVSRQIAAGVAQPVDAETVKAQVARARSGVTRAEGGLVLAHLAFNRATGQPSSTSITLEPMNALPDIPESPDSAIAIALQRRPELISLEHDLQAAQAGISLARSQSRPGLYLRGQLTEQTPTALVHEHYAAATLEIRWPLLDADKTRLDARVASAQAQRLSALLEDTRQAIVLDVTRAWQKMRDARSEIDLARAQIAGLSATATVAEKAYEFGRATAVEVQAAQRELRGAHEDELNATYDLQAASADFTYAQGTELDGIDLTSAGQGGPP